MMHQGEIKHFNLQKGFGFIGCPDFEGDVYFQRRDLPEELQDENINFKGHSCTFEPVMSQEGKTQARNVKVMGVEGLRSIGLVKSYAPRSQYGFITCPDVDGDVYFNAKELVEVAWHNQDLKGLKVKFHPTEMKDGKIQARSIVVLHQLPAGTMQSVIPMQPMGMPLQAVPMSSPRIAAPAPMQMVPEPMLAAPMGHTLGDGSQMTGRVKSFDPAKGYGFISAPNFPMDVYFKPMDPSEFQTGMEVTFTLKYRQNDGKAQGLNVCRPIENGEYLAGTVRRYNPNKGFGFFGVEGRSQDVYFQKSSLPVDLQESNAVEGAQFQFMVNVMGGKPQAQDLQLLELGTAKRPASAMAPPRGMPGTTTISTKRFRPGEPPQGMANGNGALNPYANQMGGRQMGGGPILASRPLMSAPQAMARSTGTIRAGPPQGPGRAVKMERHQGSVKSFNPQKGFGFILCPSLSSDVYFNAKILPEPFRTIPLEHRQVSFTVKYTPDGKAQAGEMQVES